MVTFCSLGARSIDSRLNALWLGYSLGQKKNMCLLSLAEKKILSVGRIYYFFIIIIFFILKFSVFGF